MAVSHMDFSRIAVSYMAVSGMAFLGIAFSYMAVSGMAGNPYAETESALQG